MARKRLSKSNLKKIPVKKWKKGDPEETCPICLDDFQEGDKLRLLDCRHGTYFKIERIGLIMQLIAYHCKCVDPWLTKNRKVCPVCKRRVGPRSKNNDSSDSDSERATNSNSIRENDSLLQNAQPVLDYSYDYMY